jgi:hypothetical protein
LLFSAINLIILEPDSKGRLAVNVPVE